MKKFSLTSLVSVVLFSTCASVFALPSFDNFADASTAPSPGPGGTYTAGAELVGQKNAQGTNWLQTGLGGAGDAVVIGTENLDYGPGLASPNPANRSILIKGVGATGPKGAILPVEVGTTMYASFIIKVTDLTGLSTATGGSGWRNSWFAGFYNTTSTSTGLSDARAMARVFVQTNNVSAGGFKFGFSKNATTSTGITWDGTAYANGTTHFIVVKYAAGAAAKMWVNPPVSTFGAATDPTSVSPGTILTSPESGTAGDIAGGAKAFGVWNRSTNQIGGATLDELRVATTWAQVTGYPQITTALSANPNAINNYGEPNVSLRFVAPSASPVIYEWRKNGTAVPLSGSTNRLYFAKATALDSGSYTVYISNYYKQVTSPVQTLTMRDPFITVWTNPAALSRPPGDTVSFGVVSVAKPRQYYQWRQVYATNYPSAGTLVTNLLVNGDFQAQDRGYVTGGYEAAVRSPWGNTLTITNIGFGNAGTYTCWVSNRYGLFLYLTNLMSGSATFNSGNTAVVGVGTKFLTELQAGDGLVQHTDFGTVVGTVATITDNFNLTLSGGGAAVSSSGSVPFDRVRPQTFVSGITTNPIVLSILDPAVVGQPRDTTAPYGVTTNLSIVAGGTPEFRYQWYKNGTALANGTAISGATNATLWLTNVTAAKDFGSYHLVLTNRGGGAGYATATSSVAMLRVSGDPFISSQPQPSSQMVAEGASVTYGVGAVGGPVAYQWRRIINASHGPVSLATGGKFTGANAATFTVNPVSGLDAGTYFVTCTNTVDPTTNAFGLSSSNLVLKVLSVPPRTVAQGGTVTFATDILPRLAQTDGFVYQWLTNDVAIADQTNAFLTLTNVQLSPPTYTVWVTNLDSLTDITNQYGVKTNEMYLEYAKGTAALTVTPTVAALSAANLVVLRAGDGVETLGVGGNSVFLDEYTTAGAYQKSLSIPNSGPARLIQAGSSANEGYLSKSMNNELLCLVGYDGPLGGAPVGQTAASVPRVIGTVSAYGYLDRIRPPSVLYRSNNDNGTAAISATNITRTDVYGSTNFSAATTDGTNGFWGAGQGTWGTIFLGATNSSLTNAANPVQMVNLATRSVRIFNNELYFSSATKDFGGLFKFTNAPVTPSGGTVTLTSGSKAVTGSGFSLLKPGDALLLQASPTIVRGTVATIASDTSLTLVAPAAVAASGAAYSSSPLATTKTNSTIVQFTSGSKTVAGLTTTKRSGLATFTSGNTAVVGDANAKFITELLVGDRLALTNAPNVPIGTVLSIESETALTLTAGATGAGTLVGYNRIRENGTIFSAELQVGDMLVLTNAPQTVVGTVASIDSDVSITLAENAGTTTLGGFAVVRSTVPPIVNATLPYRPVTTNGYAAIASTNLDNGSASGISDFAVNPAGTILYIADERAPLGITNAALVAPAPGSSWAVGGIQKWTYAGGQWSHAYVLTNGLGNSGCRFLTVDWTTTPSTPIIYATTTGTDNNRLVRVTDAGTGSIYSDLAYAGVNQLFKGIEFGPAAQPVWVGGQPWTLTNNAGSTVLLTVQAGGGGPYTYQWHQITNGLSGFITNTLVDLYTTNIIVSNSLPTEVVTTGKVNGAQSPRLSIQRVLNADEGSYWVEITNTLGRIDSQPGTLAVNDPGIVINPTNLTRYAGTDAKFIAVVGGTPVVSYQWKKNGIDLTNGPVAERATIIGAQTNVLTLSSIRLGDEGSYVLYIAGPGAPNTGTKGIDVTVDATLTVLGDPSFLTYPLDTNAPAGSTSGFSNVLAASTAGYQWLFNGSPIANETNAVLSVAGLLNGYEGSYQLLIVNTSTLPTSSTFSTNDFMGANAATSSTTNGWTNAYNLINKLLPPVIETNEISSVAALTRKLGPALFTNSDFLNLNAAMGKVVPPHILGSDITNQFGLIKKLAPALFCVSDYTNLPSLFTNLPNLVQKLGPALFSTNSFSDLNGLIQKIGPALFSINDFGSAANLHALIGGDLLGGTYFTSELITNLMSDANLTGLRMTNNLGKYTNYMALADGLNGMLAANWWDDLFFEEQMANPGFRTKTIDLLALTPNPDTGLRMLLNRYILEEGYLKLTRCTDPTPLASFLWNTNLLTSQAVRASLGKVGPNGLFTNYTVLIPVLSGTVAYTNIYQTEMFTGVTLRPRTTTLKAQNPVTGSGNLWLLNRMLLEDAYPQIVKISDSVPDPVSLHLWNNLFTQTTRSNLARTEASGTFSNHMVLMNALNEVLGGATLYDAARYGTPPPLIPMRTRTSTLLAANPPAGSGDLWLLNRLLLEDAYTEIVPISDSVPDLVSQYIWNNTAIGNLAAAYNSTYALRTNLTRLDRGGVATNINALLLMLNTERVGVSIYDATRFAGVTLKSRTSTLVGLNPANGTGDQWLLNRWLMEDAYPTEIAPSLDPSPVSRHVWSLFPTAQLLSLSSNSPPFFTPAAGGASSAYTNFFGLITNLDLAVLAGPSIYESTRFAGVTLRPKTSTLLAQNPATGSGDLWLLNRLLLEDAFPAEIAASLDVDEVSRYLWNGFSHATRVGLGIPNLSGQLTNIYLLRDTLNLVFAGASIYDVTRFAAATNTAETLGLVAASPAPTGEYLKRLNRQLVEDVYPEITKRGRPASPYVSEHLWSGLTPPQKTALQIKNQTGFNTNYTELSSIFGALIGNGAQLYNDWRFAGVPASQESLVIINSMIRPVTGDYLKRWNRLSLEDAYPEIKKSHVTLAICPPASMTVLDPAIATQPANQTNNATTTASFTVVAVGTSVGVPTTLYNNTTTRSTPSRFAQDGGVEFGDEIMLGASGLAMLTNFQFEYYGLGFSGDETLRFRLYANDGIDYGTILEPFYAPGSLLYDSGTNAIGATAAASLSYNLTVAVPQNLTWSVQFGGISGGESAGLSLYDPPTVGSSAGDYWVRSGAGNSWELGVPGAMPMLNFGARAYGDSLTAGTVSYRWKRNGSVLTDDVVHIAGAMTATLWLTNVTHVDATNGVYTVDVTGRDGVVTSQPATLQVNYSPAVTSGPVSRTNDAGTEAVFAVTVSGGEPYTYQWKTNSVDVDDGGKVSGATTASLTISGVLQADELSYSVYVVNSAGNILSSNAVLKVNDPVITTQPANQLVDPGTAATFSVAAVGTEPLSYQWVFFGTNVAGATEDTLVINLTQPQWSGKLLSVIVSNSNGRSVISSNAMLTVPDPAALVYDNTATRSTPARFAQTDGIEFGDEIVLAASGPRLLTNFIFEYYGLGFSGDETAQLRIYRNDLQPAYGTNALGTNFYAPGTLLYESGSFAISETTGSSLMFAGLSVVVPTNFTWTVQFGGITGAETAGLSLYSPPAIGSSAADYWDRSGTNNSWLLYGPDGPYIGVALNFGAEAYAAPVVVDATKPVVNIAVPSTTQAPYSTNVIMVRGTATDTMANIAMILVKVNDRPYVVATGTTKWTNYVTLDAGTNIIVVKAVDAAGNETYTPAVRQARFFVPSLLSVTTNGSGTLTPGLAGTLLNVNLKYALTATASSGYLFSNWCSIEEGVTNCVSTSATYQFTMKTNLILEVNFITNRFIAATGSYYGLFSDPAGVAHQSAGYITFKTTSKQQFSGSLMLAGEKVSFAGNFDQAGIGRVTNKMVVRLGMTNLPIVIVPVIDLEGEKMITGTVSNAGWTADIETYLAVPWAATNLAGRYTMIMPGTTNVATEPGGDGSAWLKATTDASGQVIVTAGGYHPDSGPITIIAGVPVLPNGRWPFYQGRYNYYRPAFYPPTPPTRASKQGSAIGWLSLANTNVEGVLLYNKGYYTNRYYDVGFTNSYTVIGSPYTKPTLLGQHVILVTNGLCVLQGGVLDTRINQNFTLNDNNKLVFDAPNSYKFVMTVNLTTGQVLGTNALNTISPFFKTAASGVVLQNANVIRGYFGGTNGSSGPNQTGPLLMEAR